VTPCAVPVRLGRRLPVLAVERPHLERRKVDAVDATDIDRPAARVEAGTDEGVDAALLAEAACRAAVYNVRVNVASLEDRSRGDHLANEAIELVKRTEAQAKTVAQRVESSLT